MESTDPGESERDDDQLDDVPRRTTIQSRVRGIVHPAGIPVRSNKIQVSECYEILK